MRSRASCPSSKGSSQRAFLSPSTRARRGDGSGARGGRGHRQRRIGARARSPQHGCRGASGLPRGPDARAVRRGRSARPVRPRAGWLWRCGRRRVRSSRIAHRRLPCRGDRARPDRRRSRPWLRQDAGRQSRPRERPCHIQGLGVPVLFAGSRKRLIGGALQRSARRRPARWLDRACLPRGAARRADGAQSTM